MLVAVGLVACLLGALVGYAALATEREFQFHGGVLPEDRASIMWHDAWVTLLAFGEVALPAFVALSLLALGLSRLLSARR